MLPRILGIALILVGFRAFSQGNVFRVDTLDQLLSIRPTGLSAASASGSMRLTVDVSDPRRGGRFQWERTNVVTASSLGYGGVVFPAEPGGTNGAWVRIDQSIPTPFWWGAKGDGVSDDTDAVQAMMDYLAQVEGSPAGFSSWHGENLHGGVGYLPPRTVFRVYDRGGYALYHPIGVTLVGEGNGKDFPGDVMAGVIRLATNQNVPLLRWGQYVLNGETNTTRMGGLIGVRLEAEEQSTNAFNNAAIWVEGINVKNMTLVDVETHGFVGYSLYCLPQGLGASIIRNFYGSALFSYAGDLQVSDSRFTGRTWSGIEGAAGSPFPPFVTTRFTWKNTFSDLLLFSGPRRDPGFYNSIVKFPISSYDTTENTITLASTNGLFHGMYVTWETDGELPLSGIDGAEVFFVVWSGTNNVIQLTSTSGWDTQTIQDLTGGSFDNDSLIFGDVNAPLMLIAGNSQNKKNMFSNVRAEDNAGDLIVVRGADEQTFEGLTANFVYTNTSVFIRFSHGAQFNSFSGNANADTHIWGPPQTLVVFDEASNGNDLSYLRLAGNSGGPRVIDLATNSPANKLPSYIQEDLMGLRGLFPGWRMEVMNGSGSTLTNIIRSISRSLFYKSDDTSVGTSDYQWSFDGVNTVHDLVSVNSNPGFRASTYGAFVPQITLGRFSGTREIPEPTEAGFMGLIGFRGLNAFGDITSARATIYGWAPENWQTNDEPTDLVFETTPNNSTGRVERLRIRHDGVILQSESNVVWHAGNIGAGLTNNNGILEALAEESGSTEELQVNGVSLPSPWNFINDPGGSSEVKTNASGHIYLEVTVTDESTGTVTNVALTLPTAVFDVSGSPITTGGTFAVTFDNQSANTFFAGPTNSTGQPAFRTIRGQDLLSALEAGDNITITTNSGNGKLIINGEAGGGGGGGEGTTVSNIFQLYGAATLSLTNGGGDWDIDLSDSFFAGHITNAIATGDQGTEHPNGGLVRIEFDETRSDTNYFVAFETEAPLASGHYVAGLDPTNNERGTTGFDFWHQEINNTFPQTSGYIRVWVWELVNISAGGGIGGTTNGSIVYIDGELETNPNFIGTGGDIKPVLVGTNVTLNLGTNTVTSDKIVDGVIALADLASEALLRFTDMIFNGTTSTNVVDNDEHEWTTADGVTELTHPEGSITPEKIGDVSEGSLIGYGVGEGTQTAEHIALIGAQGIEIDKVGAEWTIKLNPTNIATFNAPTNSFVGNLEVGGTLTASNIVLTTAQIEEANFTTLLIGGVPITTLLGAAGNRTLFQLLPLDGFPPEVSGAVTAAGLGSRTSRIHVKMANSGTNCWQWERVLPTGIDLSDGLVFGVHFTAVPTSGSNVLSIEIDAQTGDTDTESFDSATFGVFEVSSTSGTIYGGDIEVAESELDGASAGDVIVIRACRPTAHTSDNASGDVQLRPIEVRLPAP